MHNLRAPVIWATLSIINHFYPEFPFSKWVGLGLFSGSLLGTLFHYQKYLTNIKLTGQQLELEWMTSSLRLNTIEYDLNNIRELSFLKRNFISRDNNQLIVKAELSKQTFLLLDNDLKEKVEEIVAKQGIRPVEA